MSAIFTESVNFPSDGRATPGYVVRPDDADPHPGLVVIQEWWGLVPHIKDVCERFGREGFVALAPDLYYGKTADEPDEARKLAMQLDRARAVREIKAAAKFLKSMVTAEPPKIGIVGWCMGGALALSTAAHIGEIGAVVAFYGQPLDASDVVKIRAPVLGLYGAEDHGISVESVQAFDDELAANGIPHSVHIYSGAGHAFFNETRPHVYHHEAARDAWNRTLSWFRRYLT
jgi:carboxymethylenebutenolidase